ncbi:hypothetical protein JXJ21_00145 [candidate division KSB1 bacterium]|nr:hypothetical protein [candidate division KSB1 bacterium]
MKSIKYAVVPKFVVRKKGKLIDFVYIEEQFRNWIKQFSEQGYVISRDTSISAMLEPGCFNRFVRGEKAAFIDFAAIEFQKSDQASDYHYRIAPTFVSKVKISKSEKKKVNKVDLPHVLFEKNRDTFEKLITEYINKIASDRYKYNTSTQITVVIEPGCLFWKESEEVDFEAYEFIKTQEVTTYLCKVFPRFRSKWSEFSYQKMEDDIAKKVEEATKEGYRIVGKIIFGAAMETGCLGKIDTLNVDAFIFEKA